MTNFVVYRLKRNITSETFYFNKYFSAVVFESQFLYITDTQLGYKKANEHFHNLWSKIQFIEHTTIGFSAQFKQLWNKKIINETMTMCIVILLYSPI